MIYLKQLVIRNNKVIQDLILDFKELKPMSVFIGKNGSGKTTILESLTAIFAALHQRVEGHKADGLAFDFDMTYLIRKENLLYETSMIRSDISVYTEVNVSGKRNLSTSIKTVVDGYADHPLTKELLPNIVIYYPGSSDTLLHTYQHFTDEQEKRLRAKVKSTTDAYSRIKDLPVFYYQKQHFDMLLASLLAFEYSDDVNDFFAHKLQIEVIKHLPIILFVKPNQFRKGVGAEEFWGAEGEVRRFLNLIREYADQELEHDYEGSKGFMYSFSLNGWYHLREQYSDEKTLFLMLNMLDASDLLIGFNISLKRNSKTFPHFFLSEGERQMIITKGLAELLFDDHTLFLLDEPNVFMHPSWQSSFIEELNEYTERASFIITTHSPIILSNIRNGHLIRMIAGNAQPIAGHFYGRTYSDNLEDLLDTPSRIEYMSTEIQLLFDLIDEEKYGEAQSKLDELREKLGDNDSDLVRAQTMINFYE